MCPSERVRINIRIATSNLGVGEGREGQQRQQS
jgi:hypothetical protein